MKQSSTRLLPQRSEAWGVVLVVALVSSFGIAVASFAAEELDRQASSIGAGLFRAYCASCHGTTAKGDGDVAQFLTIKPADLTTLAQKNDGEYPFETVEKLIDGRTQVRGHGRGEMPVWGDAFKIAGGGANEEQVRGKIRALVHFIWSIQK